MISLLFNNSSRWYYFCRWIFLLIIGLVIYHQTFGFDFVFDDNEFIVINPYIKNLSNFHLIWKVLPKTRLIGLASFAFNYHFNQLNPFGYHVFNFLIHVLAVTLVWAISKQLFTIVGYLPSKNRLCQELPFIIALLYLIHPCQTQAVTYISQRFESMATLFYLSSFYAYLKGRTSKNPSNKVILFVLSAGLAFIGILTKEVAVTIPIMVLAAEWILWPKDFKALVSNKKFIAFLAGALLFGLIFMKLVKIDLSIFFNFGPISSASHDGDIITSQNYLLTQMRVFLTFIRLLIFPIHQTVDYDYPLSHSLINPPLTLIGALTIGLIIYLVIRLRQRLPLVALGLAWILITFSINMAPRIDLIFEHKLYLISFGFILAVVYFLFTVLSRKVFIILLICITMALSFASFKRNQIWKNSTTLWEDVIRKSPNKQRVYVSLGKAYLKEKRYPEAIAIFNHALLMNPNDYVSHLNRGMAYEAIGLEDDALKDMNEAVFYNPNNYVPYILRASIYTKQKNFQAAMADANEAIHLRPYFQYGYITRGIIYLQEGDIDEALKDFTEALRIAPYDLDALNNRSAVYFSQKKYELALQDLDKATKANPNNPSVLKNRNLCLIELEKAKNSTR